MESNGSIRVHNPSDSKSTKKPRQTKEEHNKYHTNEQFHGSLLAHLLFGTVTCVPDVLDEDSNHHDKNNNIEKQDDKDGAQKGSKEYCRIRDEATIEEGERSTTCITNVSVIYHCNCAISNLQSWNVCCRDAYNKISADYI